LLSVIHYKKYRCSNILAVEPSTCRKIFEMGQRQSKVVRKLENKVSQAIPRNSATIKEAKQDMNPVDLNPAAKQLPLNMNMVVRNELMTSFKKDSKHQEILKARDNQLLDANELLSVEEIVAVIKEGNLKEVSRFPLRARSEELGKTLGKYYNVPVIEARGDSRRGAWISSKEELISFNSKQKIY